MNPEYADIEWIERYLKGALTGQELSDIEQRILKDPAFAQQVEAQKISDELLEDYELLKIKKQMQQEIPALGKGGSGKYFILIGAGLLVVGVTSLFLISTRQDKKNHTDSTFRKDTVSTDKKTITETNGLSTLPLKTSGNKIAEPTLPVSDPSSDPAKNESTVGKKETPVVIAGKEEMTEVLNPKVLKEENPCSGLVIESKVEKGNTCEGKNTGFIKINILKGGKEPYAFKLNQKGKFSTVDRFEYLSEGPYTLTIKESTGCVYEVKEPITIESKMCKEPFSSTFTPSQENTWKLPIEAGQSGKIRFQDKAGRTVNEISFHNGVPYEWDGSGNRGEEIPGGYYYVAIEFSDGTLTYGYLTINR